MAFDITHPNSIFSPRDKITDVKELYRSQIDGGFSIARIIWDGNQCLGIRWNVSMREEGNPNKSNSSIKSKGNPISRGYPTWFIIPDQLLNSISPLGKKVLTNLEKVRNGIELNESEVIDSMIV